MSQDPDVSLSTFNLPYHHTALANDQSLNIEPQALPAPAPALTNERSTDVVHDAYIHDEHSPGTDPSEKEPFERAHIRQQSVGFGEAAGDGWSFNNPYGRRDRPRSVDVLEAARGDPEVPWTAQKTSWSGHWADAEHSEALGDQYARTSVGEDVVIPAHLLRTGSVKDGWNPDPDVRRRSSSGRSDSQNQFDIERIAGERTAQVGRAYSRTASISMNALGRGRATSMDNYVITGNRVPVRRTSLQNIRESVHESKSSFTLRENAEKAGSSTTTLGPDSRPVSGTYDKLSDYSFGGGNAREEKRRDSEEIDPAEPAFVITANPSGPTGRRMTVETINQPLSPQMSRRGTILQRVPSVIQNAADTVTQAVKNSEIANMLEKAKIRSAHLQRKPWVQTTFEYGFYLILLAFVYFVLVGMPLWKGAVYWLYWVVSHKFVVNGTWSVTIGLAIIYAFSPLLILFEKDPPPSEGYFPTGAPGTHDTGLMIPCYKSAKLIGATLEAATKIFPPSHIFVIANGNSPTPLDNTEEVCRPYGVNHVWSPVGSKIVAQFVGCHAMKDFKNVLLIDDDCALPPNFPVVSERMKGKVGCIGYTIKSVGPNSSRGTLCQQAQDLEYKISGLQRAFAGVIGSATFPHGAISLWNREFLIKTFNEHPGFSVSEDWFFGHVARQLGCRIQMCTSTFTETETPDSVFFSSGGARGGFGEMTIFKQRFLRWNFFFVNGMYYNMAYILGSWKLGFWEFGAKLFVFQEVYETLLYLLTPFVLPISFAVRPDFCAYLLAGTFALYFINVTIFNEVHLRLKKERVGIVAVYLYYMPYKIVLTGINVASCYWSLYKYARYFARRHPKIIEDERAVEVVLRLEETKPNLSEKDVRKISEAGVTIGRRLTVTAVGARYSTEAGDTATRDKFIRHGSSNTMGSHGRNSPYGGPVLRTLNSNSSITTAGRISPVLRTLNSNNSITTAGRISPQSPNLAFPSPVRTTSGRSLHRDNSARRPVLREEMQLDAGFEQRLRAAEEGMRSEKVEIHDFVGAPVARTISPDTTDPQYAELERRLRAIEQNMARADQAEALYFAGAPAAREPALTSRLEPVDSEDLSPFSENAPRNGRGRKISAAFSMV
ncbi:hypothetical protein LTR66_011206 [Elasticomyces elasticus]|nr:hypothetical protein LTR66_011206 [Elasticomyces elasticus]